MLRCPHCEKNLSLNLFTAFIGKMGAGKTSKLKKISSRANGKLGGRPPKPKSSKKQ